MLMNFSKQSRIWLLPVGIFLLFFLLILFSITGILPVPFNFSGTGRSGSPSGTADPSGDIVRDSGVPVLPFADNPDPDQCGIPMAWGEDDRAWLNGYYRGELIEPVVHLYDSHLRNEVQARAPHGTEVQVLLYQANPVLDYYLVKIKGRSGEGSEGWIPAPLLSFEPLSPLAN